LEVFFVDLVEAAPHLETEEEKTTRLSHADVERAAGMADAEARRSWRAARIATRILLERVSGTGLRRVPFEIEPGGRPVLAEGPHFSISHTSGIALIAVSKRAAVGVDIEAKSRSLKMSGNRRKRIIEAAGRYAPQAPLSPQIDADVLIAWVQLEAAAKALGIGIGRLLTDEGVVGGAKGTREKHPERALMTKTLSVAPDYVAAIAAAYLPDTLTADHFPYGSIDAFLAGRPT